MALDRFEPSDDNRPKFYREAIRDAFEDKFFDYVLGNPDPQPFRVGWLTEGVSDLDLYFGRGLTDEEIQEIGQERRDIEVIARVTTDDPWKLAGLRAIKEAGVLANFAVEELEFTEEPIGESGKTARNVYFKIPYPCKYSDIRKALYKFAMLLEKIGFRNNGVVDFNWMESVQENDVAFAEYHASAEIERMEEREAEALARARATGTEIDLTQAKQAIENIMRMGG
ncbi:MAG: hypothetical protein WA194_02135 [Patescibacteria group bacterium]